MSRRKSGTNKRDYYEVLGVDKNSKPDEIKRAFRKLAMKYHPDRGGDESKFKEIQEAYSVLSDNEKRSTYDRYGFDSPAFEGFGGNGFSGFGDIFDMFFGGSGPFGGGRGRGRGRRSTQQRRTQYGEDVNVRVIVDLKEVVTGVKKEIEFKRYVPCSKCNGTGGTTKTCDKCNGRGQIEQVRNSMLGRVMQVTTCPKCGGEGKIIKIKCDKCNGKKVVPEQKKITPNIPPGVETGQMLKIQGMGHIPSANAVPGDLLVTIKVKNNPDYKRDGTSIYSETKISFLQAIKGSRITIKTIDGNVKLKIPAGTQSGTEFRLKGKGLPPLKQPKRRGHHYIRIEVENPSYESIPIEAQKLMDKLEKYISPKNEVG
ncbi:MAG: DnaJ C-terminal domain-containing protein [Promethearchaeota archaeon]